MNTKRRICTWEGWALQRISGGALIQQGAIWSYQFQKIQETYSWVLQHSSFYKKKYKDSGCPLVLNGWQDFRALPLTTDDDIRKQGMEMVCVSQSQISRVVSLDTSGTTGLSKRLFFTEEDQELTLDFFHHGMKELAGSKDRVMILLPGSQRGGLADLLKRGIERIPAQSLVYGLVEEPEDCVDAICRNQITVVVGIPVQMQAVAAFCRDKKIKVPVRRVLLSTDVLSDTARHQIEEGLSCEVFNHYGMTELGYGGALECGEHKGMHIRENDLYVETVEAESGKSLPEGSLGELVITTLNRKGMPLIRYRTGDMGRILPGRCPCGGILKRLDGKVRRIGDGAEWNR